MRILLGDTARQRTDRKKERETEEREREREREREKRIKWRQVDAPAITARYTYSHEGMVDLYELKRNNRDLLLLMNMKNLTN